VWTESEGAWTSVRVTSTIKGKRVRPSGCRASSFLPLLDVAHRYSSTLGLARSAIASSRNVTNYFVRRSGEGSRHARRVRPVIVSPALQPPSSLLVSSHPFHSCASRSSKNERGSRLSSSESFLYTRVIDPVLVLHQKMESKERISMLWQISHRLMICGDGVDAVDCQSRVHAAQRASPPAPKARQEHVCART
jgi:hypothetical protein